MWFHTGFFRNVSFTAIWWSIQIWFSRHSVSEGKLCPRPNADRLVSFRLGDTKVSELQLEPHMPRNMKLAHNIINLFAAIKLYYMVITVNLWEKKQLIQLLNILRISTSAERSNKHVLAVGDYSNKVHIKPRIEIVIYFEMEGPLRIDCFIRKEVKGV